MPMESSTTLWNMRLPRIPLVGKEPRWEKENFVLQKISIMILGSTALHVGRVSACATHVMNEIAFMSMCRQSNELCGKQRKMHPNLKVYSFWFIIPQLFSYYLFHISTLLIYSSSDAVFACYDCFILHHHIDCQHQLKLKNNEGAEKAGTWNSNILYVENCIEYVP